MFHDRNRIREAQITAIHPGGGVFSPKPVLPIADRLAQSERRLLDLSIEMHAHKGGEMGALAVSIIADRAAITG